jgi:NADPH:quinone reductase-like Zn-dependent oxidoreductase
MERSLALRTAFVDAAAALDSAAVERVLDEMFAAGSYETVVERDILPALVDGRISPLVDRVFGFDELPAAKRHMEADGMAGKIVVRM